MSMIKLPANTFTPIPEGRHIFRVADVIYNEPFGKIELHCVNLEGRKQIERFSLIRTDGTVNEGAARAFAYYARVILQDNTIVDLDPQALKGGAFSCQVEHDTHPSTKTPGQTVTYIRMKNIAPLTDEEADQLADSIDDLPVSTPDGGFEDKSIAEQLSSAPLSALFDQLSDDDEEILPF